MKRSVISMLGIVFFWSATFSFAGYFVLHALGVGGEHGYFSLDSLDADIARAEAQLEERTAYREWLAHRVGLVSEEKVDADLLGELARKNGALFGKDEIVINLE